MCINANCSADAFAAFRPLFSDLSLAALSFLPTVSISRPRARPASAAVTVAARPATAIRTMSLSATGNYTRRVAAGVEIPSDDIEKDLEALPTHFSDDDVVEFSSLRKHNRIKTWFP